MTNKEMKELIKEKAMKVEVKDFSEEIIARAKFLPQKQVETIEQPRRLFNFKPLLTSFLFLMTTVFAVFLFIGETEIPPVTETPVLENIESAVALSSVQTTSLVNILETELDATTAIPLRFGPIERNARIEDEISDVSKYLETIEKLYASNEDFEVIDEPIVDGYQRRMRFRTKDLLNQTANYEMVYNQSYNKETKRFTITGEVKIGERSYPITAEGVKGEKGIIMTAKKDDSNYVVLDYTEIDGIHYYTVELVKNDLSIQKVSITLTEVDGTKIATLEFIEGESTGTYTFTIEQEDLVKIIRVEYAIDFEGDLEEGIIIIRILTLNQATMYAITVQPEGRIPFSITRGRYTPGMGMNP
ncbi:MAG: hypothetical protein A2Y45_03390 [Tenericutes bacterium GWC2_34_14]|nr:MAG: hypothetical protein A2Y45_03390 [Tenericutes bacterium GWC2_34_14]OHE34261.1 MAG: hypothetical protein A2012_08980 [Tenericutes bacterium GWE2_34_108]OHE35613.1 MAG: hypothetical protein A2Y46_05745 [Tenericutes bacterium GWF1_35_14]OHE38828.1 MAG: hypothetical protein A2Y44_00180 [Tenericutes bacterium GWF2_35_184]OHE43860.1 MAG: hypothetical protein A2221_10075 [Tenericutes bacterium RIFOXYA2_FULL_36_32]OHE46299.1 MAG: hypothetical protein A2308_02240 [Tenericutes bacterium RIFOXYB2